MQPLAFYAEHAARLGIDPRTEPKWFICHNDKCGNVIPAKLIEEATANHLPDYCTQRCRWAQKARRRYARQKGNKP